MFANDIIAGAGSLASPLSPRRSSLASDSGASSESSFKQSLVENAVHSPAPTRGPLPVHDDAQANGVPAQPDAARSDDCCDATDGTQAQSAQASTQTMRSRSHGKSTGMHRATTSCALSSKKNTAKLDAPSAERRESIAVASAPNGALERSRASISQPVAPPPAGMPLPSRTVAAVQVRGDVRAQVRPGRVAVNEIAKGTVSAEPVSASKQVDSAFRSAPVSAPKQGDEPGQFNSPDHLLQHGAVTSATGQLVKSSIGEVVSGTRSAHNFAALADSQQASEVHTLRASANSLEVGLAGAGMNGWLRVRAELNPSGIVSAAVIASSATAVESITRHLPAMTEYLAQESTSIGSIVVHASSGASASAGFSSNESSASPLMHFAGGQSDKRESSEREKYRSGEEATFENRATQNGALSKRRGLSGMSLPPAAWQSRAGTHWVSVRV